MVRNHPSLFINTLHHAKTNQNQRRILDARNPENVIKGQRIKDVLKRLNLSQTNFCKENPAFKITTFNKYLSGELDAPNKLLDVLFKKYGVPYEYSLTGNGPMIDKEKKKHELHDMTATKNDIALIKAEIQNLKPLLIKLVNRIQALEDREKVY